MKIACYSAHNFEKPYIDKANSQQFEILYIQAQLDAETARLAAGYDAISIFGNDDASAPVLDILHQLGIRFIALRSAGYNHVDLNRAHELGLRVANVPAYSPYAVAEHAVALIMALNRKLIRASARVKDMNFSLDGLIGFDMHGKTVGILGVGKIGSVAAHIFKGFGCNLLGYDPNPNQQLIESCGMQYTDLDTLCSNSDILILMAPLNDSTRYIINAKTIAKMKKGIMLINVGRGMLLDTKSVIAGLKNRHIGSLGLDVYELEKGLFYHDHSDELLQDDMIARLMTFPNVLITSHQAFLTHEALTNIAATTFENLNAWAQGAASPNEL
jgi:D-lactate dehydrogenase